MAARELAVAVAAVLGVAVLKEPLLTVFRLNHEDYRAKRQGKQKRLVGAA